MRWMRSLLPTCAFAAALAGCTEFPITPPPDDTDSMRRTWSFSTMSLVEQQGLGWSTVGDVRRAQGGTVFEEYVFGPAALDLGDGEATGEVSSSESGFRHWALAEAPYVPSPPDSTRPIAGRTILRQYQRFEKTEADAALQYAVSNVYLEAIDTDDRPISEFECPWQVAGDPSLLCNRVLWAWVTLDIDVLRVPVPGVCAELDDDCLFRANGRADLYGWYDNWTLEVMSNGLQAAGLWRESDFRLEDASNEEISHARGLMNGPIVMDIPLASVPVGDTIEVHITLEAAAMNHRQSELESFVFAHLRDIGGGSGLEFSHSGLEPIETPEEESGPVIEARGISQCGDGGGTVEFVADAFHSPEWPVGRAPVVLRRTGGSGPMSVRLSTSGGTATPDEDYEELATYVLFDAVPDDTRAVDIPLLGDDAVEDHETIGLQLSDPACGSLGGRTNATLTIYDDDRESAPSFSVGGTVTGLVGSGLELSNRGRHYAIAGNGPFTFPGGWPSGSEYEVLIIQQPSNPAQTCTVENGTGTIGDAPIEDVTVTCETVETGSGVDSDFGEDGRVWSGIVPNSDDQIAAEVGVHDGGILIAGQLDLGRFLADGAPDPAFGTGGIAPAEFFGRLYDVVYAIEVLPDGRILAAGSGLDGVNSPARDDFALARFHANGPMDTSFGNGGFVVTDFESWPDAAYDILVQPDGSIVLAGIGHTVNDFGGTNADFALARYTSEGVPDSTFGPDGNGRVTVDLAGDSDIAHAAAMLPDGRIVVVGRVMRWNVSDPDVGIAMFDADGNLDPDFGVDGVVHVATQDADQINDVAVDAAGRIVASGWRVTDGAYHSLVARYDQNGDPDGSFGSAGEAVGSLPGRANGIALDNAGRIVIVGATSGDFAVVRLLENGTTDTSFGDDGLVTADFFGSFDEASDVVVQPDGLLVVAGKAQNGVTRRVGLIRVIP